MSTSACRRPIHLLVLIGLLCGVEAADVAVPRSLPAFAGPEERPAERQEFPSLKLRGFGIVAGTLQLIDAPTGRASVMRIACADAAAARVVGAKFQSDQTTLPGVGEDVLASDLGPVAVRTVAGQGCLATGRVGATVAILAAGSEADLGWLIARTAGLAGAVWTPETTVPM